MSAFIEYFYEIKKEKLRMLLTMLGVCWGMTNIVLMLSVGEGLYRQFTRSFRGMGEGFVVFWAQQTSKPFAGLGIGRRIRLSEEDLGLIRSRVPEIAKISAEIEVGEQELKLARSTVMASLCGYGPAYGEMRFFFPEAGGRFINDVDEQQKRRVIFLGNNVRDKLFGPGVDPVGRILLFRGIPFTVIGVMVKKYGVGGGEHGNDGDLAIIPYSTCRTIFHRDWVGAVMFSPRTPGEAEAAFKGIRALLAAKYRFDPTDEAALGHFNAIEMAGTLNNVFRGIQLFLGLVGALTLIIAGIGVANIMYVTVRERTREIGIKMAVGARPGYIIGQFVTEALLTTIVGGAFGVALALGMIKGIRSLPIQHEVMEYLGKPVFSAMLALICTTILTFIGLLAGVFPARRASRVDPVEALRYE